MTIRHYPEPPIWELPPTITKLHLSWHRKGKQTPLLMLIREYWEEGEVVYGEVIYDTGKPFTWRW